MIALREHPGRPPPGPDRPALGPAVTSLQSPGVASSSSVTIAVDAGTTGVRALVIDDRARVVDVAYRELTQHYPRPGWVEHDPDEIWTVVLATVAEVAGRLADNQRVAGHRHHQPAGDGGGLGPAHRASPAPGHRLAGPPHRAGLPGPGRGRPPAPGPGAHRPGARPVLLGHQDAVAARPGRAGPRRPTWPWARSTRGCCGTSPAGSTGACSPPTPPTPRAPCSSTSWSGGGRPSCARPLRRARTGPPRGAALVWSVRAPLGGLARGPAPRCRACPSAGWPATSTPPSSVRPASTRA